METQRDLSHLSDSSFCFLLRSEYQTEVNRFLISLNNAETEILARFKETKMPPEMKKLLSTIEVHRTQLLEEISTMRTGPVEMQ